MTADNRAMRVSQRAARAIVYGAALLILAATLFPTAPSQGIAASCLLCGDRFVADAIVNICLFAPLGVALALLGRSTARALFFGALLSSAVEAAQISLIPGRDASLADLLFNTLGAAAGVLLMRGAQRWLHPGSESAARLSLAASGMVAMVVLATGWLLAPAPTSDAYYVSWKPDMAQYERYSGDVLSVTMGGRPLPPGRYENPAEIRELVRTGAPIRIELLGGGPTSKLSPFLTIHDEHRREILLVGTDRGDLVARGRPRAAIILLDYPDYQAPDGGRIRAGERALVTATLSGHTFCLGPGENPACRPGRTAGTGWSLFMFVETWPGWFATVLGTVWVAALVFPSGVWLRRQRESALAGVVLAAALLVLPRFVNLHPTPLLQLAGAAVGLLAGALVARLAAHKPALEPPVFTPSTVAESPQR